jgi:hypothetical protein
MKFAATTFLTVVSLMSAVSALKATVDYFDETGCTGTETEIQVEDNVCQGLSADFVASAQQNHGDDGMYSSELTVR